MTARKASVRVKKDPGISDDTPAPPVETVPDAVPDTVDAPLSGEEPPTPSPEPAPAAQEADPDPHFAPMHQGADQSAPGDDITTPSALVAARLSTAPACDVPTLVDTAGDNSVTRRWVLMDVDGPTLEALWREVRAMDPGITPRTFMSLVGGVLHDHGRMFRMVSRLTLP